MMEKILEQHLKSLDLRNYSRKNRTEGTKIISQAIEEFAAGHRYNFKREVVLGPKCRNSDRYGVVDYVLISNEKKYAIEIDSSNKKFSIEKLLHAHENGHVSIWVRWCYRNTLDIPEGIYLIDLALSDNY